MEIPNHLSALLVAELVVCARKAQAKLTDPAERWERLREFLQTLIRVRRQDYLAGRLAIDLELRERDHEKEKEHKSAGKDLGKAESQAFRHIQDLAWKSSRRAGGGRPKSAAFTD